MIIGSVRCAQRAQRHLSPRGYHGRMFGRAVRAKNRARQLFLYISEKGGEEKESSVFEKIKNISPSVLPMCVGTDEPEMAKTEFLPEGCECATGTDLLGTMDVSLPIARKDSSHPCHIARSPVPLTWVVGNTRW